MTVDTAVATVLLSMDTVTDLVAQRVRVGLLRQPETMPAICVQYVDEVEPMHARGSVGLISARVQVDFYANIRSGVDAYAEAGAVEDAAHGPGDATGLCGWRGSIGSPPFEITGILPISGTRRQVIDPVDSKKVRIIREYAVKFRR